ncbi:TAXI family TRAP transporter solute-binding subunit [Amphritea balenae]|uniref:TAXI family TRAP transporter solute-binding subunit n=1 Tax=Amphritea balenae TaxID=452629 RepID=A0A3P1SPG2_9GAMM|nr:TAXI family TRAP transporter solute-binding subunit [Amphritea balenae]RRC98919.1 TAXI family TRAP transporter solute-binding subunit [Amphritea balenae]
MKNWLTLFLSSVLLCYSGGAVSATDNRIVSLGTGGLTGLYYPAGGAFCRLVNQTRRDHGIRCAVKTSPGSVANINRVMEGSLDLGIAESGQLYEAAISESAGTELRSLFNLFPEFITVFSRRDSGIVSLADLPNKRINIGLENSSQEVTFKLLMKARGWQLTDFSEVHRLSPAEQAKALCSNVIDATFYVVGHPSGAVKEALRDCDSQLIGLAQSDINSLMLGNYFYQPMNIDGGLYDQSGTDVLTAGVNATLISRADMPDEVAYALVKSLFGQFEQFRRMHPAFSRLTPDLLIKAPLAAPLHPGAERYFKEIGLLD